MDEREVREDNMEREIQASREGFVLSHDEDPADLNRNRSCFRSEWRHHFTRSLPVRVGEESASRLESEAGFSRRGIPGQVGLNS